MSKPFEYTTVPGKISDLFDKIERTGVPDRVNTQWLTSIGFTSSNDRSLLRLLRFLGLVDESGVPTDGWRQLRSADRAKCLAQMIMNSYSALFSTYPSANSVSDDELASFFRSHSNGGGVTIDRAVSTFRALAELSDFDQMARRQMTSGDTNPESLQDPAIESLVPSVIRSKTDLTLNINVQLTVPETTNETVYANFFKAMRTHLIDRGTDDE